MGITTSWPITLGDHDERDAFKTFGILHFKLKISMTTCQIAGGSLHYYVPLQSKLPPSDAVGELMGAGMLLVKYEVCFLEPFRLTLGDAHASIFLVASRC